MNPALIILGVVIVLIIYLYFFYSTNEMLPTSDKTTEEVSHQKSSLISLADSLSETFREDRY